MTAERPLVAWLRGPWALPAAVASGAVAWLAAYLWAPVAGSLPSGVLLLPAAALAVAVPVLHARAASELARAAWVFAAVAGGHLAWFCLTLLEFEQGCPSGPVPGFVNYPFYLYVSATRVLPLAVFALGGVGFLVPRRTRWAGAWSLLVPLLYTALASIVHYVGPECGPLE